MRTPVKTLLLGAALGALALPATAQVVGGVTGNVTGQVRTPSLDRPMNDVSTTARTAVDEAREAREQAEDTRRQVGETVREEARDARRAQPSATAQANANANAGLSADEDGAETNANASASGSTAVSPGAEVRTATGEVLGQLVSAGRTADGAAGLLIADAQGVQRVLPMDKVSASGGAVVTTLTTTEVQGLPVVEAEAQGDAEAEVSADDE
ncbi:hypothetical protein Q0812_08250 [Brevundimonas sp. 2R-24]|uniref:PRC-barrel domain-containing protein n=1 Tax=Peiella sedimenti TaxID=3061083 RepID=A0ABT8SQ14_9CAUL|nr:hypothetical protein [Caulobacteraceae bacterium XZ-24]